MKRILSIAYWCAAVMLVAAIVCNYGYNFAESLFIGTLFLPGALAVKYFFPGIRKSDRKRVAWNYAFVITGIILAEIFLFMLAHWAIQLMRDDTQVIYDWPVLPGIFENPLFISIVIALLAVGNWFLEKWLGRKFPSEELPVTFLSERKAVSLRRDEILFIESNDYFTTVFASGDRQFRNKTPISQWESILGEGFIRIHRSYLVNATIIEWNRTDILLCGGYELPVSRKYRGSVRKLLNY